MKSLLEAGWLTQQGWYQLSTQYNLTTTETVVFLLKYGGLPIESKGVGTNQRLAQLLQMSHHTVKTHVRRILYKIGQPGNRDSGQIQGWAVSEGILALGSSAKVMRLMKDPP
jgi:hypothetical protein